MLFSLSAMPIDQRFTPIVVTEGSTALNVKGGALTKWNAFLGVMFKHSLAYKRTCSVDELAVHMANRGGLGLNAHNVHRNLAVIKSIGADREYLKKATAFEMSSGVRQERQLA